MTARQLRTLLLPGPFVAENRFTADVVAFNQTFVEAISFPVAQQIAKLR